jgi:hypothetical protein
VALLRRVESIAASVPRRTVFFIGEISSFDEEGGGQSSLSPEDKLLLSRLLLLLNPAYPASYDGKSAAAAATASRLSNRSFKGTVGYIRRDRKWL